MRKKGDNIWGVMEKRSRRRCNTNSPYNRVLSYWGRIVRPAARIFQCYEEARSGGFPDDLSTLNFFWRQHRVPTKLGLLSYHSIRSAHTHREKWHEFDRRSIHYIYIRPAPHLLSIPVPKKEDPSPQILLFSHSVSAHPITSSPSAPSTISAPAATE